MHIAQPTWRIGRVTFQNEVTLLRWPVAVGEGGGGGDGTAAQRRVHRHVKMVIVRQGGQVPGHCAD